MAELSPRPVRPDPAWGPFRLGRRLLLLALAAGAVAPSGCILSPPRPDAPTTGSLHGRVLPADADSGSTAVDRLVVYLDANGAAPAAPPAGREAVVRLHDHGFNPPFLAVQAGQPVVFPNEDEAHHRIFSYSEPNAFELHIARQESKRQTFETPGVVRFYCSFHPEEAGVVFVAPSPWFDTVDPIGAWEIGAVPPGRYRLQTWSEFTDGDAKPVVVRAGVATAVEILASGQAEPE